MYSLRLLMMERDRPETCRVSFQSKINVRYCASGWCYYRNILRCTVLPTSNLLLYLALRVLEAFPNWTVKLRQNPSPNFHIVYNCFVNVAPSQNLSCYRHSTTRKPMNVCMSVLIPSADIWITLCAPPVDNPFPFSPAVLCYSVLLPVLSFLIISPV